MDKKSNKQVFKQLGDDVMPIVAFYAFPDETVFEGTVFPSNKTDKEFSLSRDAGINVTLLMNDPIETKAESVERALELSKKYNMYYLLHSNEIVKRLDWHVDENATIEDSLSYLDNERFARYFDKYIHHPNCCGWYLWDEPMKKDMEYLGKIIEKYKEYLKAVNEEDKTYYVNLLAMTKWSGKTPEEYAEYLKDAYEKAKVEYFCYDHYPFVYPKHLTKFIPEAKWGISPGVYNMASLVRANAIKYDIPWHAFIQMGGNWSEEPDNIGVRRPTPTEVLWEVNVFLAFGAKGIHYFTWSQSIAYTWLKYRNNGGETGAFDVYGDPTDLYWAAKKANSQIIAVDEYLMHADSKCILMIGDLPTGIIEYPIDIYYKPEYKELVDVKGNALIGCFDYFGKTALYVVHNSPIVSVDTIKLYFDKEYKLLIVDRLQSKNIISDSLELCFEGGEAVLIIIDKEIGGK